MLFCPVSFKFSSSIGFVWQSCVVLGGKSEGDVIPPSLLMGTSKKQRSRETAQSGSEDDKVGPRSSVSATKTSKKSRSGETAQGGSADDRMKPRFSASVTKTSKKSRSRETAQSNSEDNKMGPRTSTPFEGKSVEEGGFSLAF